MEAHRYGCSSMFLRGKRPDAMRAHDRSLSVNIQGMSGMYSSVKQRMERVNTHRSNRPAFCLVGISIVLSYSRKLSTDKKRSLPEYIQSEAYLLGFLIFCRIFFRGNALHRRLPRSACVYPLLQSLPDSTFRNRWARVTSCRYWPTMTTPHPEWTRVLEPWWNMRLDRSEILPERVAGYLGPRGI